MSTTEYLFAIQDATGREIDSTTATVTKVSEVTVVREGGNLVLQHAGAELSISSDPGGDLWLHRWPADDKLATPVSKRI